MKQIIKRIRSFLQGRSSIWVLIVAAALLAAMTAIQNYYARSGIEKEVRHRAEAVLAGKSLKIQNVLTSVEVAVENMAWAAERQLNRPDSVYRVTRRMVRQNDYIVGSAVAFEPYYFPEKGRQFAVYSYLDDRDSIHIKQLGREDYDYHHMEWYTEPISRDSACWSEPYFDKGGGNMMMTTYSMPLHDKQGRKVGVLTADLSLGWIDDELENALTYPTSYVMIMSREGRLIAYPDSTLLLVKTVDNLEDKQRRDPKVDEMNHRMMAGESGEIRVRSLSGINRIIYYAPLSGRTGWSMAVVIDENEIYRGLTRQTWVLLCAMLLGLGMLLFILWRSARNLRRLHESDMKRERIVNELAIARNIQMHMLPKKLLGVGRDDIDVCGQLVPAREVGGDIYEYFIRNEKFYFCIGDVSGKGIPAALVMVVVRNMFRMSSQHESNPSRIMQTMNEASVEGNDDNMFVTFFIGVLDLPTGRLRYCNAGHNAPRITTKNHHCTPLDVEPNLPLGVMEDFHYVAQETTVADGTMLFLYTDGVTEAMNPEQEQFGEQRMDDVIEHLLADNEKAAPQHLVDQMTQAVNDFSSTNDASDDLTMLVLRYSKPERMVRLRRSMVVANDVQQVGELGDMVEMAAEELEIDNSTTMQMRLALEESVVNVMNYAYPAGQKGWVSVECIADGEWIDFVITDQGTPFDPTTVPDADTTLSTEDRQIGGLGILLTRQLMDAVNYEHIDGKNVLTLRKQYSQKKD